MSKLQVISETFFEGERPLFATNNLRLEKVKFYPGESPVKHCNSIEAVACEFMAKYPFWHNTNVFIDNCIFTLYSRAAIWYSKNVRMVNTVVDAPKMFRKVSNLYLENVKLPNAQECCWYCHGIEIKNVEVQGGDYIFMNSTDIRIDGFKLEGHYSFQDAKNVEVRNARIDSRDAFWETENVKVYDSVLIGEFLGWHSKNLYLENCTIIGTQPLCYAQGLVMKNCTMIDTDLSFEYSELDAEIISDIHSIKNPAGGSIKAKSIGTLIIDENCLNPEACKITVTEAITS